MAVGSAVDGFHFVATGIATCFWPLSSLFVVVPVVVVAVVVAVVDVIARHLPEVSSRAYVLNLDNI